MILMLANPFRRPLEGVGSENRAFFGPWNGNKQSERLLGPKKLRFSNSTLPEARVIDLPPSKSLVQAPCKKRRTGGEVDRTVKSGKYTVTLPLRAEKSEENPSAAGHLLLVLRNNLAQAAVQVRSCLSRDQCYGSGILDPVPFWHRDPEKVFSGSISDPGSQTHFWKLSDNFLGKTYQNSL